MSRGEIHTFAVFIYQVVSKVEAPWRDAASNKHQVPEPKAAESGRGRLSEHASPCPALAKGERQASKAADVLFLSQSALQ